MKIICMLTSVLMLASMCILVAGLAHLKLHPKYCQPPRTERLDDYLNDFEFIQFRRQQMFVWVTETTQFRQYKSNEI